MSDKIKESMEKLQQEYNAIVGELGHANAQIAVKMDEIEGLNKTVKNRESRAVSIVNKVKSLQANTPKEEIQEEAQVEVKEEKKDGES